MLAMAEQKLNVKGSEARDVVIDWIQHIMNVKGWTGTDVAKKSNLAPSTVLRLMNDPNHKFIPSLKTLQKIADGTGYPIPRQVTEALGASSIAPTPEGEESGPRVAQTREAAPSTPVRRMPMVVVKHVSSLPSTLHPVSEREIHVPHPNVWEGDDTAFAFYMPDNALEPWVRAGTLMYATRRRDPVANDMVLITDQSGRSKVRLLLTIDEKGLVLSHTHPAQEDERMTFDEIKELAIVGIIVRL